MTITRHMVLSGVLLYVALSTMPWWIGLPCFVVASTVLDAIEARITKGGA